MPWYFYTKKGSLVTPKSPSFIPIGGITISPIPFTGTPPPKFVFCNGQALLKNSYLPLYSIIGGIYGETFGVGATFNVPNFRGRFFRGISSSGSGISIPTCYGGASTHQHTVLGHVHRQNIGAHAHSMAQHRHSIANHVHTLDGHRHGNGSLTIGASNANYTTAILGTGVWPDQDSASALHAHGPSMDGTTSYQNEAVDSSSDGTGNTGYTTANLVDGSHDSYSSSSSNVASTSGSNIPSYFTMSALIKVDD